ncbi:MAG: HAMP domain-containing histidine kinase [Clostridia bacterium]|nr:HAMP domain-containing histidine kinase [Clostridia bacterium]
MKNTLFWRLFWAFVGTLIMTVLVLTFTMVTLMRAERQSAYEAEVRMQARDVAGLLQMRDMNSAWMLNPASGTTVQWKIDEIRENYGAEVWLVNANGSYAVVGSEKYGEQITEQHVLEQIWRVLSGYEIRVQGLLDELGDSMVTIGVPWYGSGMFSGRVMGAVLLHISVDSLKVDYSDLVRYAIVAGVVAMMIGTLLAWLIARRQSQPLKAINEAVTAFAGGDFERRVEIRGDNEMTQLGASFNKMAEEISNLDQSRRNFVANVSHELRSPMTCIQGYVQGMMDGTISDEERPKYLQTVLSETQRLTKLVGELLDLSRFESGKIPMNMTVFDVDELILSVLFKYEQKIEDKEIMVDIAFREQPCYVRADADRITQVVTNLIDNAVKFTREGGQLTVWTHAVDSLAYVTIKNEGTGIPAEDLPFIFERFYKVDKAHTSGKGTGLGLSIVKKILEQHEQNITVSASGSMTSFMFTLEKADGKKEGTV